jgi:hypothetical protein
MLGQACFLSGLAQPLDLVLELAQQVFTEQSSDDILSPWRERPRRPGKSALNRRTESAARDRLPQSGRIRVFRRSLCGSAGLSPERLDPLPQSLLCLRQGSARALPPSLPRRPCAPTRDQTGEPAAVPRKSAASLPEGVIGRQACGTGRQLATKNAGDVRANQRMPQTPEACGNRESAGRRQAQFVAD